MLLMMTKLLCLGKNTSTDFFPRDFFRPLTIKHGIIYNIICLIGFIQNTLTLQTILSSKLIRLRRSGTYLLFITMYGLLLSILLLVYAYLPSSSVYLLYILVILNISSLWAASVLAVDRALVNLYFGKMMVLSRHHVTFFCFLIVLFVSVTYLPLWYLCGEAKLAFIVHLSGPIVTHPVATMFSLKNSISRRVELYRNNQRPLWRTYLTQILYHSDYICPLIVILFCSLPYLLVLLLLMMVRPIEPLVSIFATLTFMPPLFTFFIYMMPRMIYMREFRKTSPCGRCLMRLICPRARVVPPANFWTRGSWARRLSGPANLTQVARPLR